MTAFTDEDPLIRPDGLSIRRRRHDHSWSKRECVEAIGEASFVATGLRRSITPSQLRTIEEQSKQIPYSMLRLVARGLDCDPVDILGQ